MRDPVITKTRYVQGLQCSKLLWHLYNAREVFPPVDERTQAVFDQGHAVGRLAQQRFPGGIAIPSGSEEEVVARSQGVLTQRRPLFEAGFRHGEIFARADVLEPVDADAWNLVEVKSAASAGDPYWDDLAIQRHCYQGAGLEIRRCFILHVDTGYVRRGPVDPAGLFALVDATDAVEKRQAAVPRRVRAMVETVRSPRSPVVDIGPQCHAPYACPLIPMCWKHVLEIPRNVFSLTRIGPRAWRLYRQGVTSNERIPASFLLSRKQRVQVDAERTGTTHVNARALRRFLGTLRYPLHYLDFETLSSAIPLVEGTRPYQQVPFQFSLHVAAEDGGLRHHSWIWDGRGDPTRLLLERLQEVIGPDGSVMAYGAAFERQRLLECAAAHPGAADWVQGVVGRLVDLLVPFRSFWVYHPSQGGSASMKRVLPALTGRSYKDLDIHEGGQASLEFRRVTFGAATEEERRRVFAQLEEYCGLDTLGMTAIVEVLRRLAG